MKIRDCLFHYLGLTAIMGTAHLRVYSHEGSIVAVVGELADNPSTSITNAAENVCSLLRTKYGPEVIIIEYYPRIEIDDPSGWSTVISPPDTDPVWGPLTQNEAEMLAGEPLQTWPYSEYTMATISRQLPRGLEPE